MSKDKHLWRPMPCFHLSLPGREVCFLPLRVHSYPRLQRVKVCHPTAWSIVEMNHLGWERKRPVGHTIGEVPPAQR